jgi:hypothetical protein
MANESYSQLPVAKSLSGAEIVPISAPTGLPPGMPQYVSQRTTTGKIAQAFLPAVVGTIEFLSDGANVTLLTGVKGYLEIPFTGLITRSTLLANQTGSIVIDIWKCTEAQFDGGVTHPVVTDSITSGNPPTITNGIKAQDNSLVDWTTNVNVGDVLAFNINSVTNIQRITLSLGITRTDV